MFNDVLKQAMATREAPGDYIENGVLMCGKCHTPKQVLIDLFGCVIAKHNIRTQHKYIPVIDLKRIEELLSSYSLNSVFHLIRNHEYEIELPEDAILTHQDIDYAGFKFKIPAICFGAETEL